MPGIRFLSGCGQRQRRRVAPLICGALLSLLAPAGYAEDVHEHGIADLLIAIDDHEVMIRLESPAANLLGFENAPSSDSERAAAAQLIRDISDGGLMRVFDSSALCTMSTPQWTTELFTEESVVRSHHAEHGKKSADSGQEHKHEHKHEHEDHAEHEGGHADIDIEWQAQCSVMPVRIDHTLFTRFDALHEIRISLVGASGQQAWKIKRGEGGSILLNRG